MLSCAVRFDDKDAGAGCTSAAIMLLCYFRVLVTPILVCSHLPSEHPLPAHSLSEVSRAASPLSRCTKPQPAETRRCTAKGLAHNLHWPAINYNGSLGQLSRFRAGIRRGGARKPPKPSSTARLEPTGRAWATTQALARGSHREIRGALVDRGRNNKVRRSTSEFRGCNKSGMFANTGLNGSARKNRYLRATRTRAIGRMAACMHPYEE